MEITLTWILVINDNTILADMRGIVHDVLGINQILIHNVCQSGQAQNVLQPVKIINRSYEVQYKFRQVPAHET